MQIFLDTLDRLLTTEELSVDSVKNTTVAQQLSSVRKQLRDHLQALTHSDDLALIIATEKAILQGDLSRYANSQAMSSSLNAALEGMDIIETHLDLVTDNARYRIIDQGHRLSKNRRAGLPFDEARQAVAGHHARLMNMDKSRLDEDDKQVLEIRKTVIAHAQECYARRQAATLGIDSAQG